MSNVEFDRQSLRDRAAAAARTCLLQPTLWRAFLDEFGESDDVLISDLVDLIEHEPQRGGLLGVNDADWHDYQKQIAEAIKALSGRSLIVARAQPPY